MRPAILAGLVGGTSLRVLDFTSGSLPTGVTLTRAGSRTAIQSGVLVVLSSNVPAFESWGGEAKGLSIDGAATNLVQYSNDPSNAYWSKTQCTVVGQTITGPDGVANSAWDIAEAATTNTHRFGRTVGSAAAGTRMMVSAFVAAKSGSAARGFAPAVTNEFSDEGARILARLDGVLGAGIKQDANWTTPSGGMEVYGTWARVWSVGTKAATGNWTAHMRIAQYVDALENYLGATANGLSIYGMQAQAITANDHPGSYIATVGATASRVADQLVMSDLSGLDLSQGTIVIEHDCESGTLIGTGSTAVLASSGRGLTAIAWSGSTSDTVSNGGAGSSGGAVTFGSDVRILGTSAASNTGRVKRVTIYPQRMTVAQMQAATTAVRTSTANPTAWRIASTRNKLPAALTALTTSRSMQLRLPVTIAGARSKLRLSLDNWAATSSGDNIGNDVSIEALALEKVTGGAAVTAVTIGGSGTYTLAAGASAVQTDDILPSAFGLSEFADGSQWYIRARVSVASSGQTVPCGRWSGETGATVWVYNPASTTPSAVVASGSMSYTGTAPTVPSRSFSPLVIGVSASGDPKSIFVTGDSLIEGTSVIDGTFVNKATIALGLPYVEHAVGGQSHAERDASTRWRDSLPYGRVLVDNLATNSEAATYMRAHTIYNAARLASYDSWHRVEMFPRTTSTDSWATEANQTIASITARPSAGDRNANFWAAKGWIAGVMQTDGIQGADTSKWIVTGAANYATSDGVHQSAAADNLLVTQAQAYLSAVSVTS